MASSLIRGLLAQGQPAQSIWATDVDVGKLESLAQDCGINSADTSQIAASADVIVLAVKPQVLSAVCAELTGVLRRSTLVVSIVAGARIASIAKGLGHDAIVRTMPNTPAQVGEGMTVWTATAAVSHAQREQAGALLGALGKQLYVQDEGFLDKATAVSGSGPA